MNTAPEIAVFCLASGSSGNALLVTAGDDALFVDAGLGVRSLRAALKMHGIAPERLRGVLLTHEHVDHVRGAVPLARAIRTSLIANDRTLSAVLGDGYPDAPARTVATGGEIGLGVFGVRPVRVRHDAADPVGWQITVNDQTIFYATDTGTITPEMRAACVGASLIVLEANHCRERLRRGPYPERLKRRIVSEQGHLANDAACGFLLAHTADHGPACVWLAHLSAVNNTPRLVQKCWQQAARVAGFKTPPASVEIALRDRPSLSWRSRASAVQLRLF